MKKKYLILVFIILTLGTLLILANVKLPISLITKEKINEVSGNKVNLLSFSNQYFKLLPAPNIILIDPVLDIKALNINSEINIDRIEINRSLLDKKNYSISANEGLLNNNTKFKNLKIDLSLNDSGFNLITNNFKLDQSNIQINLSIEKQKLKSFGFNITKLNLKKNYKLISKLFNIESIRKLNISDEAYINAQGIYENNQIIVNQAEIKISNNSSIYIEGVINPDDLFLSSLEIAMENIDINLMKEIIKPTSGIYYLYNIIPQGKITSSKFIIEEGLLNIKSFNYTTEKTNQLSLESLGPILDMNNPSLDLKLKINNFKEISDINNILLTNHLQNLIDLANITKGNMNLFLENKMIEIKNLILTTKDEEDMFFNGDYNIIEKNFSDLKIEINNLSRSKVKKILQFYEKNIFDKYMKLINFDKINTSLVLSQNDKLILITKLELINDDISTIEGLYQDGKIAGSANIKNIDLRLLDQLLLKTGRINGSLNLDIATNGLIEVDTIKNIDGLIKGLISIEIENSEIALLGFLESLTANVEDLGAFNNFMQILVNSFMNKKVRYEGDLYNNAVNKFEIKNLNFIAPDGSKINSNIFIDGENFEIILIDVFKDEDFILTIKNGVYNFKRRNTDGVINKPLEELIKKNLNQLFENLLN